MAYQTYTTEAFVCGVLHRNTSDCSYLLFTESAGMVWATARSVREERSKQRFALQLFSYIKVSLVKGKSGWRIGSVEAVRNTFLSTENRSVRAGMVMMVRMLRQYIHGEEPLPIVFGDTRATMQALVDQSTTDTEQWLRIFEVRLLHQLGYVSAGEAMAPWVTGGIEAAVAQPLLAADSRTIDTYIETARKVSHL